MLKKLPDGEFAQIGTSHWSNEIRQACLGGVHFCGGDRLSRFVIGAGQGNALAVPFLDPAVVPYALTIPVRWKFRGSNHKKVVTS